MTHEAHKQQQKQKHHLYKRSICSMQNVPAYILVVQAFNFTLFFVHVLKIKMYQYAYLVGRKQ